MPKLTSLRQNTDLTDYSALFGQLYAPSVLPSVAQHAYWLHAKPKTRGFSPSDVSGKWCIFRSGNEIDAAWELVKKAVASGKLTFAKVSTKLGASTHRNNHVICVYTVDYQDENELTSSRATLRKLGFIEELGYKRDIDTRNNVYGPDEWYRKSI